MAVKLLPSDRLAQQPKDAHEADASAKMIQEAMEHSPQWHKTLGPMRYNTASMAVAQREQSMFANGFDFAHIPLDTHEPLKQLQRCPAIESTNNVCPRCAIEFARNDILT